MSRVAGACYRTQFLNSTARPHLARVFSMVAAMFGRSTCLRRRLSGNSAQCTAPLTRWRSVGGRKIEHSLTGLP
jgi:GH24 family phage-related lysozyme (muramidase)